MLPLNSAYVLVLEVINGSNLVVPSHRMPAGLYVSVSTAYGQWNTAIKTVMVDSSIPWNQSLVIQGRPLTFPQWLTPVFHSTSRAVHLEIRASFETVMLGRGELVSRVETTLEELLMHGKQFEVPLSAVRTRSPSLLLRAQHTKLSGSHTACGIQHSGLDVTTDAAHEAYTLYRQSNHRNDLDIALERFQTVLDQCPPGHPHRAAALSNIAHAILYGFTKGVGTDIDYVISLFRSALELRPPGNPDHLLSVFDLCRALHQRYLHLQKDADLREVVKLYLYLLPLCAEGSYLQLCVIEECNALRRNPSDESISLRRIVPDLCQQHRQHHARSLNRLAGDLYARFEQSGDIDHINEAIHLSREALAICPSDGERSFLLSVLSYTLKLRFQHLRYPDDINECISLNREALVLRPVGHPAREKTLNNLARALKARYDQYGEIADLEEAMHLSRAAHDLRSRNSGTPPPQSEHIKGYVDLGRDQLTPTSKHKEERPQQPPLESLMSDHQRRPRAKNIVIFGEAGSGKSSVVNAIAQNQVAATSSSVTGCTFRYKRHEVEISGETFVLFDTMGLDEGTARNSLLRELTSPKSDGIGLLVYCVRGVRVSRALLRNYNLFYSAICRKKVPIVVVVTGLENQEPTMDSWWDTNGIVFKKCGMHFEDHACVTTLRDSPDIPDIFTHRIRESREVLRGLILNNRSESTADESWFKLSFADVRNMINSRWNGERSSPSTLIICGRPQEEVQLAHGIYGVVETCFVRIGGVKYRVHSVPEPESLIPTSSVDADLLIYYASADEKSAARRRFGMFCAPYRENMVPVIVVVKGLNDSKAAQAWVEHYLTQNDAGRQISTFSLPGGTRDLNAEQALRELIQQSLSHSK